jgi:hypothetical protein
MAGFEGDEAMAAPYHYLLTPDMEKEEYRLWLAQEEAILRPTSWHPCVNQTSEVGKEAKASQHLSAVVRRSQ